MRINIYQEEITEEVVFVEKHVAELGRTYYGVRIFLKSHEDLHHTTVDDDRSAVTFWFGTKERAILYLEKAYWGLFSGCWSGSAQLLSCRERHSQRRQSIRWGWDTGSRR
jgi:hypothetical protein